MFRTREIIDWFKNRELNINKQGGLSIQTINCNVKHGIINNVYEPPTMIILDKDEYNRLLEIENKYNLLAKPRYESE